MFHRFFWYVYQVMERFFEDIPMDGLKSHGKIPFSLYFLELWCWPIDFDLHGFTKMVIL